MSVRWTGHLPYHFRKCEEKARVVEGARREAWSVSQGEGRVAPKCVPQAIIAAGVIVGRPSPRLDAVVRKLHHGIAFGFLLPGSHVGQGGAAAVARAACGELDW